ncbi:type II secretion system protein GspL [Sphingomonas pseudosanguinis]|uniref:General secretion pathway protein L n=1 Tax=Sphingomonas pseudosanguinis TaxID=413712 RepID=A0A7W6F2I3_9SPHN|nr:type II secretion system protein GspL [Sphingomonas pseudosanguinis]MBB3878984.1 general secretion pathway protein L [Sphingomonas pseudosanguinis]MBN3536725.1 general secretion pathway protein GspL [Sphingomonas pseudosanguinis]
MSATNLLFLPPGEGGDYRWMRIEDERIAASGEGLPQGDGEVIAVAPADAVSLHWADIPARSTAQAAAAARLLAAEVSAAPMDELHVAVGEDEDGGRPIGIVNRGAMAGWLARLGAAGVDPVAVVPAPLLLPRPDEGYVRGDLAGQGVVRGRSSGFADEPGFTEIVTGEAPLADLDVDGIEAALGAVAAAPALDLRQGPFARRRGFTIDWRLVKRLAWLGLTIIVVTLAIDLVKWTKYSFAADATEAKIEQVARTALPRGETLVDADRQLTERLSAVRGPGQGFSRTAAAIFAAVRGVPGTELTALDFQSSGDVRLGVAVDREALATDLKRAIEAQGFTVQPSTFVAANGRITGEFTVRGR